MARVTYYVALPFVLDGAGEVVPSERAVMLKSEASAILRASALAAANVGAIAFSRTGDPKIGEYDPAEVLAKFGTVPQDLRALYDHLNKPSSRTRSKPD